MTKFVVGIDLALNVSGVSIFYLENGGAKPLRQFTVDTSKIKEIHSKAMYMKSLIMENLYKDLNKNLQYPPQLDICIEIGNYGNAKMTSSFSQMYGNLECWFRLNTPKSFFNKVNVWKVSPNDWFEKFNKQFGLTNKHINQLTREQRKEFSISKANEVFKIDTQSNDISDSVWIAYYAI